MCRPFTTCVCSIRYPGRRFVRRVVDGALPWAGLLAPFGRGTHCDLLL